MNLNEWLDDYYRIHTDDQAYVVETLDIEEIEIDDIELPKFGPLNDYLIEAK